MTLLLLTAAERERCYTIAKCVYLEGNSGGSKMKGEGGTGPGRVQHLVLILMIGIYFESYVLATCTLKKRNGNIFKHIASNCKAKMSRGGKHGSGPVGSACLRTEYSDQQMDEW